MQTEGVAAEFADNPTPNPQGWFILAILGAVAELEL